MPMSPDNRDQSLVACGAAGSLHNRHHVASPSSPTIPVMRVRIGPMWRPTRCGIYLRAPTGNGVMLLHSWTPIALLMASCAAGIATSRTGADTLHRRKFVRAPSVTDLFARSRGRPPSGRSLDSPACGRTFDRALFRPSAWAAVAVGIAVGNVGHVAKLHTSGSTRLILLSSPPSEQKKIGVYFQTRKLSFVGLSLCSLWFVFKLFVSSLFSPHLFS